MKKLWPDELLLDAEEWPTLHSYQVFHNSDIGAVYHQTCPYDAEVQLRELNQKLGNIVNMPRIQEPPDELEGGVFMEFVEGERLTDYLDSSWNELEFSAYSDDRKKVPAWLARQLRMVHLFDHYTDQTDRHGDNLLVDPKKRKLWVIDNSDYAWGDHHCVRVGKLWVKVNISKLTAADIRLLSASPLGKELVTASNGLVCSCFEKKKAGADE